jgi:hypothetical protein
MDGWVTKQAGGTVIRFVGLYHMRRGAHEMFLRMGKVLLLLRARQISMKLQLLQCGWRLLTEREFSRAQREGRLKLASWLPVA